MTAGRPLLLGILASLLASIGCERVVHRVDFERMIRQRKCVPYSSCRWLPGDHTMQPSPAGTVPRHRIVGAPALTDGIVDDEHVDFIPLEVDVTFMRRGANRFEIFCAACHGVLGDGRTKVAKNMSLRRPPSLHEPRITEYPPGRIFRIITEGYGLMPAFDPELSLEDRWAVVAYIQALQLSQHVVLADQDEAVREAILEMLP
jgi:hypothetical protein